MIVGATANHGDGRLDTGIRLAKLPKVLPGGPERPVDAAPTAHALVWRKDLEEIGPIPEEVVPGDAARSRRARANALGELLRAAPVVALGHAASLAGGARGLLGPGRPPPG